MLKRAMKHKRRIAAGSRATHVHAQNGHSHPTTLGEGSKQPWKDAQAFIQTVLPDVDV